MNIKCLLIICISLVFALGNSYAQKLQFTKNEKLEISIEAKASLYELPKLNNRQIGKLPKPVHFEYNKLRKGLSRLSKNRNLKNQEIAATIKQIEQAERNIYKLFNTGYPKMTICAFKCNDLRQGCQASCKLKKKNKKIRLCGCVAASIGCYFKCPT